MLVSDLEKELKKVGIYKWGSRQKDIKDYETEFIKSTNDFSHLTEMLARLEANNPNFPTQYAINRWYNFWCSQGVEALFARRDCVEPEENKRHKTVDFKISGVSFDLKLSVMPMSKAVKLPNPDANLRYWQEHSDNLIYWFYSHQSAEKRHHMANRLFVVCYDLFRPAESWKLKKELGIMNPMVGLYHAVFRPENIPELIVKGYRLKSDIIFFAKRGNEHFAVLSKNHIRPYKEHKLKHFL